MAPDTLSATLRELAQQPAATRTRWLQQCAEATPTLYAALTPFLAALGEPEPHPPAAQPADAASTPGRVPGPATAHLQAGTPLGAWTLDEEIGRGGMGVVWRGHRSDGRFERQVAIKLLPPLFADATLRARFLRETQALARLAHPHIAALLDAGQTEDGTAWLVMELVSGASLLHHVRTQACGLRARVGLMLQLADAVAHAHRHLLVHRDLKPGNVMVDGTGQVKLLDFGVTKLLDDAGVEPLTREIGGFTPGYASPEQVQGDTVTTLSDVFSLGVMLHELLTDQAPFLRPGSTWHETLHRTLNDEVGPPSRSPQALPGIDADLDAITQRALAKRSTERLPGADALAADLRAWLEGRPVSARAPSWRERSWMWVRRNRVVSATAAIGLVGTLGFAAFAQLAAQEARAQAQLAQHRLQQVRSFAGKVIHDYNGLLVNLPGAIPARERLVSDALAYLDAMAGEQAGRLDPGLQRELAGAYLAIGNVQGRGLGGPGLGQFDAALRSFEHAEGLLRPLAERTNSPPREAAADHLSWAEAREARAQVMAVHGNWAEARDLMVGILATLRQVPLSELSPADLRRHRKLVAAILGTVSSLESRSSGTVWAMGLTHAREFWEISQEQLKALDAPGAPPVDEATRMEARLQLAFAADLGAFQRLAHGRAAEGLAVIVPVVAQARTLAQQKHNREMQILLSSSTQTEGELRLLAGQIDLGLARLAESARLAEAMYRAEPENTQASSAHLMSVWRMARAQRRVGQAAQSLQATQGALRAKRGELPPYLQGQVFRLEMEQALSLLALNQPAAALAPAQRAQAGLAGLAPATPSRQHLDLATAEAALAMALGADPRTRAKAASHWQQAHRRLSDWLTLTPADIEAQAQLWRLCQLALARPAWLGADEATLAQAAHSLATSEAALTVLTPERLGTPAPTDAGESGAETGAFTARLHLPRVWREGV